MSDRASRRHITALHCRSSVGLFGPERALMETVPALRDQGVETCLLALYRAPLGGADVHPWIAKAKAEGLVADQVLDPGPLSVAVVRRMAQQVRRSCADILHTHDYRSNILGGMVARRVDRAMPWVATVHLHTTTTRRLRLYRALDLFLLRLADRVITVSRDQRRLLLRRGVDRHRLILIPTVIDALAFAAGADATPITRARLGVQPSQPLVTFLGRLSAQKGVDNYLRAAQAVLGQRPDARFLVVGSGPQRIALEALARDLGIDGSVCFLGYQSEAASILAASDVVVLPSRAEGHPVVLLEALALARPVVASCVGGIPDLVRHDQTGLLVPRDAPQRVAECVLQVLNDRGLARRLGDAGRQHVIRQYTPERAARRMAAVYRVVLAERD